MNVIGIILLSSFFLLVLYLVVSMWIDVYNTEKLIIIGSKWEIWEGDPFKGHNVVEIVDEKDGYVKYRKQTFNSDGVCVYSESNSMSKRYFVRELVKTRFKQIQ